MKGKQLFIYMCFMIIALYRCGIATSIVGVLALAVLKLPFYVAGAQ